MKFKMRVTMTFDINSDTTYYGDKEVTPEEAAKMESRVAPEELLMVVPSHDEIDVKVKVLTKVFPKYTITINGSDERFTFEAQNDEKAKKKATTIINRFAQEDDWTYLEYRVTDEHGCEIDKGVYENEVDE